ncbi:MAG: helix-turn-helix transcriptional regulator, partial [Firmicutes bacterium]|nr:helix-turn-helix transcriptional regulator [Bacillota bacterium]
MDHIRNKIGSRLRLLRLERELTQEQLAGKAGLHPTYIAKIETGRRLPSLE